MKKSILRKIDGRLISCGCNTNDRVAGALLLVLFAGVIFGALVGICSVYTGLDFRLEGSAGQLGSAWLFFLLLFVFSTSYLGVFLIPALMFVRGYLFSCSVSVLYSALGLPGLLFSLLGSGLPLCFLLPCYILVGADCFLLSRRLAFFHSGRTPYSGVLFPARHFLALLLMILLDSLYSTCILPMLTSSLI